MSRGSGSLRRRGHADGEDRDATALAAAVAGIIAALLVAGRGGAPAEGRIPFNPLYFHLLRRLDAGGPTRPSALADALGVSRTTLSTAVKALSGRGLVDRRADRSDGRAHEVVLTDEGRDVLAAIRRQDLRNAAAMLSCLEPAERAGFVRAATKVAAGLADGAGATREDEATR